MWKQHPPARRGNKIAGALSLLIVLLLLITGTFAWYFNADDEDEINKNNYENHFFIMLN